MNKNFSNNNIIAKKTADDAAKNLKRLSERFEKISIKEWRNIMKEGIKSLCKELKEE